VNKEITIFTSTEINHLKQIMSDHHIVWSTNVHDSCGLTNAY